MISSKSSPKRNEKVSSNQDLAGFDLLYQLTYLSAVATAGIAPGQMFSLAAKLPCTTARYFAEVDSLARGMNMQYSEACRIVGESTRDQEVKSLLLRLSGSLTTGEAPSDFLKREAEIQAESYGNAYERKLESLKKWTDSYVALLVSVALIIVVAAVSTMIYDMGAGFVTALVAVMVGVSAMGAWIISRASPHEIRTLAGPAGHKGQRLPRTLFILLLPAAMVTGAVLFAAGVQVSLVMIVIGLLLLPIGIAGWRVDKLVNGRDMDISAFLRVLGATASTISTTPAEALGRMDLRSMGSLAGSVKRLHTMLLSRINTALGWHRFVVETSSELIARGVRIFVDGTGLGGDAEEVGTRASLLTMKVNFLRAKRRLVSATFVWLSMIMHAVVIFLLIFIIEVVDGFGRVVAAAGISAMASGSGTAAASALSFNFSSMQFMRTLVIVVALLLSVVNALAPKVADGGYSHKLFLYMGATTLTAGLGLYMAPKLANMFFAFAPAAT